MDTKDIAILVRMAEEINDTQHIEEERERQTADHMLGVSLATMRAVNLVLDTLWDELIKGEEF